MSEFAQSQETLRSGLSQAIGQDPDYLKNQIDVFVSTHFSPIQ